VTKETKEARFIRVAEKRVQNILKSINSFSKMANKKAYAWNNDQLQKIWAAIEKELDASKGAFKDPDSLVFKL
jgi:hypothetical protein